MDKQPSVLGYGKSSSGVNYRRLLRACWHADHHIGVLPSGKVLFTRLLMIWLNPQVTKSANCISTMACPSGSAQPNTDDGALAQRRIAHPLSAITRDKAYPVILNTRRNRQYPGPISTSLSCFPVGLPHTIGNGVDETAFGFYCSSAPPPGSGTARIRYQFLFGAGLNTLRRRRSQPFTDLFLMVLADGFHFACFSSSSPSCKGIFIIPDRVAGTQ